MIGNLKKSLILLTLNFSIAQGAAAPQGQPMGFIQWVATLAQDLDDTREHMPITQFGEQCDRDLQGQIIAPSQRIQSGGNHNTCWLHMIFQAALVRAIAENNETMVAQLSELQFGQRVQSEFLTDATNPQKLGWARNSSIADFGGFSYNVLEFAAQLLAARNEHKVPDNPALFFKWLANNRPGNFFPESPNQDLFNYVLDTYRGGNCPCVVAPFYSGRNVTFDQFFSPQAYQTPNLSATLVQLIEGHKTYVTVNVLLDGHWVTLAIFRNRAGRISYVLLDSLFAYARTDQDPDVAKDLKGSNPDDKAKVIAAVLNNIRELDGQVAENIEGELPQVVQNLIARTEWYGENMRFGIPIALLFVQASKLTQEESEAQEQLEQARDIFTVAQTQLDEFTAQLVGATQERDALVERLRQETQSANDAAYAQALERNPAATPETIDVNQVIAQNHELDQLTQEITRLQNELAQPEAQTREAQVAFNKAQETFDQAAARAFEARRIALQARAAAHQGQPVAQPNPAQGGHSQPLAQLSSAEVNEAIQILLAQQAQDARVNAAMEEILAAQNELEAAIANQTTASERLAAQLDIDNPSPEVQAQIDQANALVAAAQDILEKAKRDLENALRSEPPAQPYMPTVLPARVSAPAPIQPPAQDASIPQPPVFPRRPASSPVQAAPRQTWSQWLSSWWYNGFNLAY